MKKKINPKVMTLIDKFVPLSLPPSIYPVQVPWRLSAPPIYLIPRIHVQCREKGDCSQEDDGDRDQGQGQDRGDHHGARPLQA
jgi:hypothetical protein